jgi:hypothetical protein
MKVSVVFSVLVGMFSFGFSSASATQTTWDGKTAFGGVCCNGFARAGYINFFRNVEGDPASELGDSCLLNWTDSRDSNLTNTADRYVVDAYGNNRTVGRAAGSTPRTHRVANFMGVTPTVRLYHGTNCQGPYRPLPQGQTVTYALTNTSGLMSFRGMTSTGTYPACP